MPAALPHDACRRDTHLRATNPQAHRSAIANNTDKARARSAKPALGHTPSEHPAHAQQPTSLPPYEKCGLAAILEPLGVYCPACDHGGGS